MSRFFPCLSLPLLQALQVLERTTFSTTENKSLAISHILFFSLSTVNFPSCKGVQVFSLLQKLTILLFKLTIMSGLKDFFSFLDSYANLRPRN